MIKSIPGDMIQDDFRAGAANEITPRFYARVMDKPELFSDKGKRRRVILEFRTHSPL
jgi:hypothetical protein